MTEPRQSTGASPAAARPLGRRALVEALGLWALALAAIALTRAIGPLSGYAKAVAAVAFLYLPGLVVWRRGEDYRDYGATLRGFGRGLRSGLVVSAIILPLYVAAFLGFAAVLHHLPGALKPFVPAYPGLTDVAFRLPDRFLTHVIDQIFVVALPEEFFYRGYLQARLRDVWPSGRGVLGARLGAAFFVTQVLFALGHLAEPHPWRLAVFFPALVFGVLRERSGTVVPSTVFHALSNLTVLVLEASLFGRR